MLTEEAIDAIKEKLVEVGDTIILKHFDTVKVENKFGTAVTQADKEAGIAIDTTLRQLYPDWPILNEETAPINSARFIKGIFASEYFWTVDPIDGTTNYSMGNPNFCTGIALCHCENGMLTPVWGMMFDPTRKGFVYLDADRNPVYELVHSGYKRVLKIDQQKLDALVNANIVAVRQEAFNNQTCWQFEKAKRNQFIESQIMNGMLASSGKLTAASVGGHLWDFAAPFALARALDLGPFRRNGNKMDSMRKDDFILSGANNDDYWRLKEKENLVIIHPSIKKLFFKGT